MGNLRNSLISVSVGVLGLAGCSKNSTATVDAPPIVLIDAEPIDAPKPIDVLPIDAEIFDFTCLNNTAPTTAANTISIGGTASELVLQGTTPTAQPVAGASIELHKVSDDSIIGTASTSAANGTFSQTGVATTGAPLDAYLISSKTGDRTTLIYPPSPFIANADSVPVLMLSNALVTLLGMIGITQTPENGIVGALVTDCANAPINGVTLTVTQGGNAVGNTQDGSQLGSQGAGTFVTFQVPPGDTLISASYMGMTFRAHSVKSVAGQTSTTQIKPGF